MVGGCLVVPAPKWSGYTRFTAMCAGRRRTHLYIHRVVWEAFKGPIPKGWHVDHRDRNPSNNKLSNLKAMTAKDNTLHAGATISKQWGVDKALIRRVFQLSAMGKINAEVAVIVGRSSACVSYWLRGHTTLSREVIAERTSRKRAAARRRRKN